MSAQKLMPVTRISYREQVLLKGIWRYRSLYLMILPVTILFFIFNYLPILWGAVVSLYKYTMFDEVYVGLENYFTLWQRHAAKRAFFNTFIITFLNLSIGFWVPIIFALLINELRNLYFRRFVSTLVYLPYLFSWIVVAGLWMNILSTPHGWVNQFRELVFGFEPVYFLGKNEYIRSILVGTGIWKVAGFFTIIYLARIATIDPDLYDAARVDGATRFQQAKYITIPCLKDTMVVVFLLNIIIQMRIFDQVMVLVHPLVYEKGDVVMTYVYREAFINNSIGLACAAAMTLGIIALSITFLMMKVTGYGKLE